MKKSLTFVLSLTIFSNIFAFDWPTGKVDSEKITNYFAQKTATSMSSYVTLKETEDVMCSDNGNTLIILENSNDDTDFFPSALGSAVIIRHDDNLISVYSNLDKESIKTSDYSITLFKHDQLAKTGTNTTFRFRKVIQLMEMHFILV